MLPSPTVEQVFFSNVLLFDICLFILISPVDCFLKCIRLFWMSFHKLLMQNFVPKVPLMVSSDASWESNLCRCRTEQCTQCLPHLPWGLFHSNIVPICYCSNSLVQFSDFLVFQTLSWPLPLLWEMGTWNPFRYPPTAFSCFVGVNHFQFQSVW